MARNVARNPLILYDGSQRSANTIWRHELTAIRDVGFARPGTVCLVQDYEQHEVGLVLGPSFRGASKRRTRNLEIPGLVLRTIPE